jgi:hypothetical protein
MGLDVYLYHRTGGTHLDEYDGSEQPNEEEVEIPSEKYPEHYWKIGYFRSSYNSSGINHILDDRIGESLYSICGAGDDYIVTPDWQTMKENGRKARERFLEWIEQGSYGIMDFNAVPIREDAIISSAEEAMKLFRERIGRDRAHKGLSGGYSDAWGDWFLEGEVTNAIPVRAFIKGFDVLRRPCIYAVYEVPKENWTSYVQSLEILEETCDYVLSQPDPENYVLHWSS